MLRAKVLVVDPEALTYEALKPGLSKHGYEIHTTTTTPEALSLAGAHDYKVALVALTSTGDEALLTGLQAERPGIPVIIVCSSETRGIPAPVVDIADNAMGKPLILESVLLMLDRCLELTLLRSRLRQLRQDWSLSLALEAARTLPEPAAGSLDEVLTHSLRTMVSNMGVVGRGTLHRAVLSHVEKLLLTIVLDECRGNQLRSADILGINRNTLRKKIRDFGISSPRRSA
jgi:DNA-binding NtrC family response regulator